MKRKRVVRAGGFKPAVPGHVMSYPIFRVETERAVYEANDLNEVMHLWRAAEDPTKVLRVSKQG